MTNQPKRTPLGERVARYRSENGAGGRRLTLRAMCTRLASYGWQGTEDYLSKVETGKLKTPSDGFLAALSTLLKMEESDLRALCKKSSSSEASAELSSRVTSRRSFRLAFGHSLWGAPILDAAQDGRLPMFLVASYATRESPSSVVQPVWIGADAEPVDTAPNADHVALSAADVVSMVRKGDVDLGAIPGNIAPEPDFIRLATIVDSAAGCVLMCDGTWWDQHFKEAPPLWNTTDAEQTPGGSTRPSVISTNELAHYLCASKSVGRLVRIGVEENTVGVTFLEDACRPRRNLRMSDVAWYLRTRDLATLPFTALKKRCHEEQDSDLIGVIVWEPHATWMNLRDKEADLRRIVLQLSPDELHRPRHYSYELVVRDLQLESINPRRQELIDAISMLIRELDVSAHTLTGLRNDSTNASLLERLAKYYRICDQRTGRPSPEGILGAMKGIRFSIRVTPAGLKNLQ